MHNNNKNEIQILAVRYVLPNELKSVPEKNINVKQQHDNNIKKIIN